LVGQASGETHRLGDHVSVRLVEAAPVAGALRFELLSEGQAPPSRRRGAKPFRGKAKRDAGASSRKTRRSRRDAQRQKKGRR
jgi:ribonuclease R